MTRRKRKFNNSVKYLHLNNKTIHPTDKVVYDSTPEDKVYRMQTKIGKLKN